MGRKRELEAARRAGWGRRNGTAEYGSSALLTLGQGAAARAIPAFGRTRHDASINGQRAHGDESDTEEIVQHIVQLLTESRSQPRGCRELSPQDRCQAAPGAPAGLVLDY